MRRVVGITSLGRAHGGPAGLLTPALAVDALIEETGGDHRALAMPFFMENLLHHVEALTSTGTFSTANTVDRPLATVATHDIAEIAAHLLLDDSWSGRETVPVIGPDDLTPEEMAQVMSEVLERPVRARQVAPEDHAATMARYGRAAPGPGDRPTWPPPRTTASTTPSRRPWPLPRPPASASGAGTS
ncbi:hypothetical protein AB0P12_32755 [Streptomyces subrutilus]|uniref:hypothetical protein n=1 Tax=Streptomyces subrutilus TaxID=36818 RepID=UPI003423B883